MSKAPTVDQSLLFCKSVKFLNIILQLVVIKLAETSSLLLLYPFTCPALENALLYLGIFIPNGSYSRHVSWKQQRDIFMVKLQWVGFEDVGVLNSKGKHV